MPCSGFVIIGFNDEGSTVAIHHTNMNEIAHAMARSGLLLASAHLGKAIKEATRMQKEDDFSDFLKKLSIRIGG